MIAKTAMSRFFVALKPDVAAAVRLAALAEDLAVRCGGRALAAGDLHMTVAFIGERPADDGAQLLALLQGPPARLPGALLDTIGRFSTALLWSSPSAAPEFLVELARSVGQRLDDAAVAYDRRPLHPHLTLVRSARNREAARSAVGSCNAIEVAHWTLALGGTYPAATPPLRYRWYAPSA